MFGPGGVSNFPGDAPVGTMDDVTACKAAGKGPAYVLPVGAYPPFTRFPKFVVDFQLQERHRMVVEEDVVRSRRSIGEALAARKSVHCVSLFTSALLPLVILVIDLHYCSTLLVAQERASKEEAELLVAAEQARLQVHECWV